MLKTHDSDRQSLNSQPIGRRFNIRTSTWRKMLKRRRC